MRKIILILSIIRASLFISAALQAANPEYACLKTTAGRQQPVARHFFFVLSAKIGTFGASHDFGHPQKRDDIEIMESRFSTDESDQGTLWFKVQNAGQSGWVSIREAQTYSSETQARNAALRME